MTTALYVGVYALFTAGGVILLRSALDDARVLSPSMIRTLLTEPQFLVGFALYALSFFTWLLALRRYEVSGIFPVFIGTAYCAVLIGALVFLGERLSLSQTVGVALIFVGILLAVR